MVDFWKRGKDERKMERFRGLKMILICYIKIHTVYDIYPNSFKKLITIYCKHYQKIICDVISISVLRIP